LFDNMSDILAQPAVADRPTNQASPSTKQPGKPNQKPKTKSYGRNAYIAKPNPHQTIPIRAEPSEKLWMGAIAAAALAETTVVAVAAAVAAATVDRRVEKTDADRDTKNRHT